MLNRTLAVGLGLLIGAGIVGCQKTEAPKAKEAPPAAIAGAEKVTTERLLNAASEPQQWMTYNGSYSEQRYSTLSGINKDNVKTLGLAWFADYDTNLTQAGTPLAVDGAIYVSTAWSKVYAFDARTGKQLWQYNPQSKGERVAQNVCCGIVNRGIAAYNGKIYVGTLDGRLVALDSKTGEPVWEKLDHRPDVALLDHERAARRPRARCSSATPVASTACAVTSARMTPKPASRCGASIRCRATRASRSRTRP